jgi:excisionase family DNA binding protein
MKHDDIPPLAVGASEAARMLGISTRTLWAMTNCGKLPYVKLGRRTLYPIDDLRAWLQAQTQHARH